MPRLLPCLLLLVLSARTLHAAALPAECALIDCVEGSACGKLPDGSVGCIPFTTPPTETFPEECLLILCAPDSNCGFTEDGIVGCIPFTTPPTATVPEECARILCAPGNDCGFTEDGSVGCIPFTTPPTATLPPACAAISCEIGSDCGVLDDGTVGCIPGGLEQCKGGDPDCLCSLQFTPTPCCKDGVLCEGGNACLCKCSGGVPAQEDGSCPGSITCSNVKCSGNRPLCIETKDGPKCVGKLLTTPPPTNPPTETLPPECAAISCPFGSPCGLRKDGTVGCFTSGAMQQCPVGRSGCICTALFDPTPCCVGGVLCEAGNPCACGCSGGASPQDDGTCATKTTCANVRCGGDKPVCIETENGPECVARSCSCPKNLDWTCCERADGSRYDAANACVCKCKDKIVGAGRCDAACGDKA